MARHPSPSSSLKHLSSRRKSSSASSASSASRPVNGRGWFVWTVSCLRAGADPRKIVPGEGDYNPYTKGTGGELGFRLAAVLCERLGETLAVLLDSGVARTSRKGWLIINHPILGQVSWKSGSDFRTAKGYLFLRVNGRLVLSYWPSSAERGGFFPCVERDGGDG